jgi:hypothetical protein
VYPAIADNYSSPCVSRLSEGNQPVVRARIEFRLLVHASVPACRHTLPRRLTLNSLANLLPRMRLWPWWHSAQPPFLARPHMIRAARRHRQCLRPPHPGRALAVGHFGRSMDQHVSLVAVGIHVYDGTVRRLPSFHNIGAARGRRYAAFQPVLTRDTRREMERDVFTLLSTASH